MEKLFVGAYGGAGTRVVMEILKEVGYYVGEPYVNEPYDFRGNSKNFVSSFDHYWRTKNSTQLRNVLKFGTDGHNSWALKHGQMMFILDELKEWYPKSKSIYVMRNPIDNALNQYFDSSNVFVAHNKYGGLPINAPIDDKIKWCIEQSKIASNKADYTLILEDLCNNKESEIKRLLEFIGAKYDDIDKLVSLVIRPKSIGRGKEHYSKYDLTNLGF